MFAFNAINTEVHMRLQPTFAFVHHQ